jgi:hypothetical protein
MAALGDENLEVDINPGKVLLAVVVALGSDVGNLQKD